MPIALTAKIRFSPRLILESKWAHDMVHRFVFAKSKALRRNK